MVSMRLPSLLACVVLASLSLTAKALPSFGSKIPNGERVPCPDGADANDCLGGYCRGLGHGSCAGGISGIPTQDLNPFGTDWRDSGFEWTADLCQADSDGDGYTNGEELGDPCCVWVAGAFGGTGDSQYTANFVPSHPGNPDHRLPEDYERPSCDGEDVSPPKSGADDGDDRATATGVAAYNPGEEQRSFDFRIKDYPIPRRTTTYVDFLFNIPEDIEDIVHIVYGEVLMSQPKHLHHFVVQGCSERVPEEMEGQPTERVPDHCNVPVGGFSGWAPGVTMWGVPTSAGVPIGKGFGIQALSVNVHFTDGDAPYLQGEQAISTDGFRVHYTPDLRPKTVTTTPVIQVGFGPMDMNIEPNKKRAFMTRTCTVESRCQDTDDSTMNMIGSSMLNNPDLTCAGGAAFCSFSEPFRSACPESCGLCEDEDRNPDEYNAIAVFYHAHLIGAEMYTTLIPKNNPEERINLKSRNIWTYEDQTGYDLEDVIIRPGDKIQTTCVYDSTERSDTTQFSLSTYDEMCLNTITTIFDTPVVGEGQLSAPNEVAMRGFRCEVSEEGDIWLGALGPADDGVTIMDSHPLSDAECSFPTGLFIFDSVPTQQKRCNGEIVEKGTGVCSEKPGAFFNPTGEAGSMCQGGLFSERDSNDGTTQLQCTSGGGTWIDYSCFEAQEYLKGNLGETADSETKEYLKEYWWAPKCCLGGDDADDADIDDSNGEDVDGEDADGEDADGDNDGDTKSPTSSATIASCSAFFFGAFAMLLGADLVF